MGFGAADEMDWQPEPVVRVLILGSDFGGQNQTQNQGQEQWQQYQQQQQQYQQNVGDIGPVPYPGPWPWPAWREPPRRNPAVFPVRVPPFRLPVLPTASDLLPPGLDCCSDKPETSAGPVPRFGLIAGSGGVGGGAGSAIRPSGMPSSPCPDCDTLGRFITPDKIRTLGPMKPPALTSTCGPTLRTETRRRSSDACMFSSCVV